jgi:hypothetical protein
MWIEKGGSMAGKKAKDTESAEFRKCFGYMDHMARRHPHADAPEGDEHFDYPASGEDEGRGGSFMVIQSEDARRCSECPLFERCASFTEISRKYSANPLNRLARMGADMLQRNKDSKLFKFFS